MKLLKHKEKLPMKATLVWTRPSTPENPRNSEGAFLRGKEGEILFAYSCYAGDSFHDHAACNVALITSYDEGETWSEPRIIAHAKEDFGTQNIMSVSSLVQKNGDLAFYFMIKENDFTTTMGRVISTDGKSFRAERCSFNVPPAYYIVNNDRVVRLSDGRIVVPTAWISAEKNRNGIYYPFYTSCLISEDDGQTFIKANFDFTSNDEANAAYGYQEPGIIELEDRFYLWMRTGYGRQYESVSREGLEGFCPPYPSIFTSPMAPMQIKKHQGVLYNAYNPKPRWNGSERYENGFPWIWCRSPIVLRKSVDDGKTWGPLNILEEDPDRGFSYPSMFFTEDGHLLIGYCRGSREEGSDLCSLGISKVDLSTVE